MTQANKVQIRILTEFMEAHPCLAKAFSANGINSKESQKMLWERLTRSLNINGPPTKAKAEWKRIWTTRKYNAKKKLVLNQNSIKLTGGGPFTEYPLDSNEEAIVQVCGMEAAVAGISGVSSFGCEEQEFETEINGLIGELLETAQAPASAPVGATVSAPASAPASAPVSATVSAPVSAPVSATVSAPVSDSGSAPASAPGSAPGSIKRNVRKNKATFEDESILLAKKQIELQEKFLNIQIENCKSLKAITGAIHELKDCVTLLFREKERDRQSSTALKKEELQLKRMELEYAKAVNELRIIENQKT